MVARAYRHLADAIEASDDAVGTLGLRENGTPVSIGGGMDALSIVKEDPSFSGERATATRDALAKALAGWR